MTRRQQPDLRSQGGSTLTLQAPRAFFPARRELALLRAVRAAWLQTGRGVAVEVSRHRPPAQQGFWQVTSLAVMSDDWPGMGEACLGVVHERGWNVQFAHGLVIREQGVEIGVFIMAVALGTQAEAQRLDAELGEIVEQLRKLGIGRRAKMILLARETKKLKVLTSVIEELADLCTDQELEDITAPLGECSKFFGSRSDEYVSAWSARELANQVLSNYRLLAKVRGSGGLGMVTVEARHALRETRTCLTVVGLRRDVSVEDCLRVVGDTLGFYEQYHLMDFSTRDGLALVRLEIGPGKGRHLSEAQRAQLGRRLNELISGRRAAWAHRIESRGGFEQYARAVIPFLLKEHSSSGLTQVYIALSSREATTAGFKLIFVYAASLADIRPAQRFPELLQRIPGVSIDSVVPARTMGAQRFFIMNITVDLGQFDDTEAVYLAIKEKVREVFPAFRDFDEGMRRLETTRLKDIERAFSERQQTLADRVFYSMDEFSRLSMSQDEMVVLVGLARDALHRFEDPARPVPRPVVLDKIVLTADGFPSTAFITVAGEPGYGIPSCISELQTHADVTVSQFRYGDADLTLCRVVGQGGGPLPVPALREVVARLTKGDAA